MDKVFIKNISIKKLRYLEDININIGNEFKHLIITGKNGSGKTSLLNTLSKELGNLVKDISSKTHKLWEKSDITYSFDILQLQDIYLHKGLVFAYFKANRLFEATQPKHVEKVELSNTYAIDNTPQKEFVKYLLDLKMTEALAISNNKIERAKLIKNWFNEFENLLKKIFQDQSLRLEFDEETYRFSIIEKGKEPFDFNTLSDGFAAILDIVVGLIMRMEKNSDKKFKYDMRGIVLIDEIETHLHLELQKHIMTFLVETFPNLQFIVSTHSPFILNSIDNTIIYDLEKQTYVKNGLSNLSYSGIVEGYFKTDELSNKLREKFDRYKVLTNKDKLSNDEIEELNHLEFYLDEIPDYLDLNITTEYKRIKFNFENRVQ